LRIFNGFNEHESTRISPEALRELQNYSPQRRHSRHLQQQAAQAAAGLTRSTSNDLTI
jgi:hypothetical protein